jgi:hypothetical protein
MTKARKAMRIGLSLALVAMAVSKVAIPTAVMAQTPALTAQAPPPTAAFSGFISGLGLSVGSGFQAGTRRRRAAPRA